MVSRDKGPEGLRAYKHHGLEFEEGLGKEAVATCPFCEIERKFTVNTTTGQGRCFNCSIGGDKGGFNPYIFVNELWKLFDARTNSYNELSEERGIEAETLMQWGCAWSHLTNSWVLPGFNVTGKLLQLYQYRNTGQRQVLMGTATLGQQLFGMQLFDSNKSTIWICEGPWDAMRLWENLKVSTNDEDGNFVATAGDNNLLADANVIAIPGCTTFLDSWAKLFKDKTAIIAFDNDLPRKVKGKTIEPPSVVGMRNITQKLSGNEDPPYQILGVKWGEKWYDQSLKTGFDLRDLFAQKEG